MIIFFWLLGSLVIGIIGSDKTLGFWGSFFISLLVSPVIGLIIVLLSKTKEDEAAQKKMVQAVTNQQKPSTADELKKLLELKEKNAISDTEFEKLKAKLLQ